MDVGFRACRMGTVTAANLLKAGHQVTVYNPRGESRSIGRQGGGGHLDARYPRGAQRPESDHSRSRHDGDLPIVQLRTHRQQHKVDASHAEGYSCSGTGTLKPFSVVETSA
jgi:hypothetical protein